MRVTCDTCETAFLVDDCHAGRRARCSKCKHTLLLPIEDSDQLIDWVSSAPWHRVFRFVTGGGARGHSPDVISELIRAFEERRFSEENVARLRMANELQENVERQRKSIMERERQRLQQQLTRCIVLENLLNLSAADFELLIANLYRAQGYEAFAVGGAADQGIDVEVYEREDQTLWAIAQCKRYALNRRISSSQIRDFVGSFNLSDAVRAFYFTTSDYTNDACETASNFPWLTLYDGISLVALIEEVKGKL